MWPCPPACCWHPCQHEHAAPSKSGGCSPTLPAKEPINALLVASPQISHTLSHACMPTPLSAHIRKNTVQRVMVCAPSNSQGNSSDSTTPTKVTVRLWGHAVEPKMSHCVMHADTKTSHQQHDAHTRETPPAAHNTATRQAATTQQRTSCWCSSRISSSLCVAAAKRGSTHSSRQPRTTNTASAAKLQVQ